MSYRIFSAQELADHYFQTNVVPGIKAPPPQLEIKSQFGYIARLCAWRLHLAKHPTGEISFKSTYELAENLRTYGFSDDQIYRQFGVLQNTLNREMKALLVENCDIILEGGEEDFDVIVEIGPYFPKPGILHICGAHIAEGSKPAYEYPADYAKKCYRAFQNDLMSAIRSDRTLLVANYDTPPPFPSQEVHR